MDALLFWIHILIIVLAVASGFFLPLPILLVLVVLHKIHLVIFGDCVLTLMKRHRRVLGPDEDFLQYAAKKLFGLSITKRASAQVNYGIYGLAVLASLSRLW